MSSARVGSTTVWFRRRFRPPNSSRRRRVAPSPRCRAAGSSTPGDELSTATAVWVPTKTHRRYSPKLYASYPSRPPPTRESRSGTLYEVSRGRLVAIGDVVRLDVDHDFVTAEQCAVSGSWAAVRAPRKLPTNSSFIAIKPAASCRPAQNASSRERTAEAAMSCDRRTMCRTRRTRTGQFVVCSDCRNEGVSVRIRMLVPRISASVTMPRFGHQENAGCPRVTFTSTRARSAWVTAVVTA